MRPGMVRIAWSAAAHVEVLRISSAAAVRLGRPWVSVWAVSAIRLAMSSAQAPSGVISARHEEERVRTCSAAVVSQEGLSATVVVPPGMRTSGFVVSLSVLVLRADGIQGVREDSHPHRPAPSSGGTGTSTDGCCRAATNSDSQGNP